MCVQWCTNQWAWLWFPRPMEWQFASMGFLAQNEYSARATKGKGIGHSMGHRDIFSGDIRDVIQVTFFVWLMQVNGWRQYLMLERQSGCHNLYRSGSAH